MNFNKILSVLLFCLIFGTVLSVSVRSAEGTSDVKDKDATEVSEKDVDADFPNNGASAVGNRMLATVRKTSNDEKPEEVSAEELKKMDDLIARMDKESRIASIMGHPIDRMKNSEKLSMPTASRALFYKNCRSIGGKMSYCGFTRNITGVTLVRRYSFASCNAGYDYAYLARFLIIADGCHGRFLVRTY